MKSKLKNKPLVIQDSTDTFDELPNQSKSSDKLDDNKYALEGQNTSSSEESTQTNTSFTLK